MKPQPSDQNSLNDHATADKARNWQSLVPTRSLAPVLFGFLAIMVFMAGFGFWAISAPLSGAAVVSGVVVASGENQAVQHLEGGLIGEISVAEGDVVKRGSPLIRLDQTLVQTNRNRVRASIIGLEAQMTRWEAERDSLEVLTFDPELESIADAENLANLLEEQKAEFGFRKAQHRSELSVLDQRKKALEEEIEGLREQASAEERKLAVLKEELESKKGLLNKGLTPRAQYNALLREEADSIGRMGGLKATIGQRKTTIAEAQQQQSTMEATRRSTASKEANRLRNEIGDLREQLIARDDILKRSVIRAPVDGVVVNLAKNTIGSVIRPGETVLSILPTSSDLVVEVRIQPQDIDIVTVGQNASLRFSALNARTTPEVPAIVEYLSADRLVDEATREPYYSARLKLASELPEAIRPDQVYPGMPVDAFIKTGDRTFLEYLTRPIQDSFNKAFRED